MIVHVVQPLVLAMETVMITQPMQRVTQVTVVQTATVRNRAAGNGAAQGGSVGSVVASIDPRAGRMLSTASARW